MWVVDSILGVFNTDVISKYKNLVNNHPEAFRRWKGKQIAGTLSQYFEFEPTYNDKSYIASHEKEILAFEVIIAEEKAFEKRRQELIRFDDEVLDNETRAKYYQGFCKSKSVFGTEEEKKLYCVGHLIELDAYAHNIIESAYSSLKRNYPLGLNAFENAHKDMVRLQIIDYENEIKIYEENYKQVNSQNEWENDQKVFTQESRNLNNSLLTNYGCYVYDIPFQKLTYDGKMVPATYRVWQHFCKSYCDVEDLDYSYYPSAYENYGNLAGFKAKSRYFYDKVYDKIIEFIGALKQKHNNIAVALGDSSLGSDSVDFNNYHFSHLKQSLSSKHIKVFPVNEIIHQSTIFSYIVIIELISTNEGLITTCKKLIDSYKEACPQITYVSLCKGYSKSEMTDLINQERQKKEQAERAKREEEECKERERLEKERKEEERIRLKQNLQHAVQNWKTICGIIKYIYLFNYYPTTCDFEATESEWDNRWLVWNFKNTPGKTSASDHTDALNNIVPRLKKLLINTFGLHNLKELVLVCIPASSQQKTILRYQEFSQMLCSETGMTSAFDKMTVIGQRIARHLGGTSSSMNIEFDNDFFNGKFVILFDDIVTKGNSMLSFKHKMEELGAIVVGGISIGKTTHIR